MTIYSWFCNIPKNVKIILFCGIFVISGLLSYMFYQDTKLIEKRISSRQKELLLSLQLRDSYESKKRLSDRSLVRANDQSPLSLALIEDVVGKTFLGGKLIQLQPVTSKEIRGERKTAVEVKISGAPLNEVITFVKTTENSGFQIGKIRLSSPATNPMALDMQITIVERRIRG
jgi:hypothetical protein